MHLTRKLTGQRRRLLSIGQKHGHPIQVSPQAKCVRVDCDLCIIVNGHLLVRCIGSRLLHTVLERGVGTGGRRTRILLKSIDGLADRMLKESGNGKPCACEVFTTISVFIGDDIFWCVCGILIFRRLSRSPAGVSWQVDKSRVASPTVRRRCKTVKILKAYF